MKEKEIKQMVGEKSVDFIKDGMIVGLGTGTTAYWMIRKLGERVKEGLDIKGISSSHETTELAIECGIPLIDLTFMGQIDVTIDGADEVDEHFNLIKGGGGALFREKMLANNSKQYITIIDESKLTTTLQLPLPIEVIPFSYQVTAKQIESTFFCKTELRLKNELPFLTDNGNYVLDCYMDDYTNLKRLNQQIKQLTGVVETGLFIDLVDLVIVGYQDGTIKFL